MENKQLSADVEKIKLMPLTDKKKYAKELYWTYASQTDIARTLEIKLPTLKAWVYGSNSKSDIGWKAERELSKNQLMKDLTADKKGMVYNMVNGSLFLIHDFVEKAKLEVVKSGKPIDIRTAEKLTNILGSLHKMVQDEQDSSDDANFVKPTSVQELQKRVVDADPFAKKVEVVEEDEEVISEKDLQ